MEVPAALDLVFVCDCTGSMGSYLQATQQNIYNVCFNHNSHLRNQEGGKNKKTPHLTLKLCGIN